MLSGDGLHPRGAEEATVIWKVVFAVTWLFIEGTGIPLLSEGAFGPLGAAVHKGQINIWLAFLLAWCATAVGNTLGFMAFTFYGPRLFKWVSQRWPKFEILRQQVESRAKRHIFLAITISRFIGLGTFGVVLWLAGILGAPPLRFLPFLYGLNLFWTGLWLFGSTWLVKVVLPYLEARSPIELLLLAAIAVPVVWIVHLGVHRLGHRLHKRGGPERSV